LREAGAGTRLHWHFQSKLLRRDSGGSRSPRVSREAEAAAKLVAKHLWSERFEDIRNFERYLARNGVAILKFFLHVSKTTGKKRFLERITIRKRTGSSP